MWNQTRVIDCPQRPPTHAVPNGLSFITKTKTQRVFESLRTPLRVIDLTSVTYFDCGVICVVSCVIWGWLLVLLTHAAGRWITSTAHFLQENIGPGTYRTLLHQEHSCGCMMGSSVAIRNSRPGGRPHCRHLAGASPVRNQVRSVRKSAAITDASLARKEHFTCQNGDVFSV